LSINERNWLKFKLLIEFRFRIEGIEIREFLSLVDRERGEGWRWWEEFQFGSRK